MLKDFKSQLNVKVSTVTYTQVSVWVMAGELL